MMKFTNRKAAVVASWRRKKIHSSRQFTNYDQPRHTVVILDLANSHILPNRRNKSRNGSIMYSSSKGNPSRIICVVLFVAIAAVGVGLGVHYLAGGKSTVPQSLKDIQLFKKEAPFTGNPNATNRWDHTGDGLNMTIINALDQQWYTYFYTAVKNWDNGSPDALTLTTQTSQSDSSCTGVMGVIKVCNGDYGATDWKGINTVLLDSNGFITTSSARMNDHFFTSGGDDAKRLYTMCHEVRITVTADRHVID